MSRFARNMRLGGWGEVIGSVVVNLQGNERNCRSEVVGWCQAIGDDGAVDLPGVVVVVVCTDSACRGDLRPLCFRRCMLQWQKPLLLFLYW